MRAYILNLSMIMILNTIDLTVILRFYGKVFGKCRLNKWKIVLGGSLFLVLFSGVIKSEIMYSNLVNIVAWSIVFLFFFQGAKRVKVWIAFAEVALAGICQSIPYFFVKKYEMEESVVVILAGHLLFLMFLEISGRAYKVHKENLKRGTWVTLLLVPIASFVSIPCILLLSLNSTLEQNTLYYCLLPVLFFFIFINLIAFYLFDKLSLLIDTIEEKVRLEEQLEYQAVYYQSVEESQASIRSIKHDMRNSLEAIQILLAQNKISDAKVFIEDITKTIVQAECVVCTQNAALDTIINIKLEMAKRNHIEFIHKINIPPNLPISYKQSTAILGNLLDNALEAQEYLAEDKRKVELTMTYHQDSLMINVKNAYDRNMVDTKAFRTNKKDSGIHGIGLQNVKKAVEELGGVMRISAETKEIQTDILI